MNEAVSQPTSALGMFASVGMYGSVALFLVAGALGSVGFYELWLKQFFEEVQEEGGASLIQSMRNVFLRKLGSMNRRVIWPRYEMRVRKQLVKAGDPAGLKPEEMLGLQEISFVFFTIFGLMLLNFVGESLLYTVGFSALGAYYPQMWLGDQVKKRHLLITRALPYSLDLLTLSVEAGLDFTGALAKVVEKGKKGPLNEELGLVLKQLKMGKTREECLKSMIQRVDLPPLTTFVTALIQADKMGTSLGKVLRIQSTQLRIERTQRAEKLAGEAPVKMLFPLIACIFPCVFAVLFGPIIFAMTYGNMGM